MIEEASWCPEHFTLTAEMFCDLETFDIVGIVLQI